MLCSLLLIFRFQSIDFPSELPNTCLFYNVYCFTLSICGSPKFNTVCTVRAPVFGRHQLFGTSEHYGKTHGSLLSGWMNYNYTSCRWFPTSSNIVITSITILTNQVWKLLIALFKVLNTGVFTVSLISCASNNYFFFFLLLPSPFLFLCLLPNSYSSHFLPP